LVRPAELDPAIEKELGLTFHPDAESLIGDVDIVISKCRSIPQPSACWTTRPSVANDVL
jgi:hypothetical protein